MPTGTLPLQPFYGTTLTREAAAISRRFADGTYRRYVKSTVIREYWELQFKDLGEEEKDSLLAFWGAHIVATSQAAAEFTFNHPVTGDPMTAVFLDEANTIKVQFSGPCRYGVTIIVEVVG